MCVSSCRATPTFRQLAAAAPLKLKPTTTRFRPYGFTRTLTLTLTVRFGDVWIHIHNTSMYTSSFRAMPKSRPLDEAAPRRAKTRNKGVASLTG